MIDVKTFFYTYSNCYLVSINEFNIVIDPSVPYDYLNVDKVDACFITHAHFDHFSFLETYLNKGITFYMDEKAYDKLFNNDLTLASLFYQEVNYNLFREKLIFLKENDEISIGEEKIKTLKMEGHTSCSIIILIRDLMFSGDTLFKGSVGRCDFPTGNSLKLKYSLDKIKKFKVNYHIYPGHDDDTFLFEELKFNKFLR